MDPVDGPAAAVLAVHLAATCAMVGLIWFVQVVHYPGFELVGADRFVTYEAAHTRRTTWVVGPPMAVEGLTALWLVAAPPDSLGRGLPIAGAVILGVVHTCTVLVQVPLHGSLATGFDAGRAARLVHTNWVRTVGWSLRGVLAVTMVVAAVVDR
jgi:hypothetical protein